MTQLQNTVPRTLLERSGTAAAIPNRKVRKTVRLSLAGGSPLQLGFRSLA